MVRLVAKFKYLSMKLPHRAVAAYLYLCDRGMMAGEGELPTVGRFTAEKNESVTYGIVYNKKAAQIDRMKIHFNFQEVPK